MTGPIINLSSLKRFKFFYLINDIKNYYFNNLKFIFKYKRKLQFITVPRTGCTLCINMFNKFRLNIDWNNHYVKPKYNSSNNYIISIRNPVDRFISAFYHAKYNQQIFYHKDFFILYPEIDDLAKNIHKKEATEYIRLCHFLNETLSTFFNIEYIKKNPPLYILEFSSLHKDIYFFLKNFNKVDKKKIAKFLSNIFGSSPNKKKLSSDGKKKLNFFLREDIKVYNYLIKNKPKINSNFNGLKFINKNKTKIFLNK